MTRFVALLRGVNVGKAKRVPMADFRTLLSRLGYTDVATLLNSGNAVFHAAKGTPASHSMAIAAAIVKRFEFDVPVIVKSAKEFATIVAENPIRPAAPEHSQFLVAFTQDSKALTNLAAIKPLVVAPERFTIGKNAAYLHCAGGILESKAGETLLGKAYRSAFTTRNWATVLKLQALANDR